MKRFLLFVPDGVGIRNYLYTQVFKNRDAQLHLYHSFDTDTLRAIKSEVNIESDTIIPAYSEGLKEKYLRELIHLCRLKYNVKRAQNITILNMWFKKRSGLKLQLFYSFITFMARFYNSYGSIEKLEAKYQKQIRKNPLYNQVTTQLKSLNVDLLFCTHQRALKAPVIFAAAMDLGIKTYTVIYSWDNIPKARLALKADYYFVWSAYMKQQLQEFYPEIDAEKICITGTPQFEMYSKEEYIIPKAEFYNSYNLDPNKKIICFSGDDEYTSPKDPEYLRDLANGIVKAGREQEYQILFRRCPVDLSGRYDWVVNEFKDLIKEAPPLWNFNSAIWSAVYPTKADLGLLVSVAYYCHAVVNVGSTMAFDFGMFNKPCIYINYDQVGATPWSVDTIYKYEHFKSMPDKGVVLWWNNKDDVELLLAQLETGKTTPIGQWFNTIVAPVDSSHEIYNTLMNT